MKLIVVNCKLLCFCSLWLCIVSNAFLSCSYNDELESELSKELENGRLARLLCKMGFINERPE